MQINNSISFGQNYSFFQNQSDFLCAYCGKRIVPECEIKKLSRKLEGQKGLDVAQTLYPYLELMQDKNTTPLSFLIEQASKYQFRDWTFKRLAMLIPDKNIFNANNFETLKKLLDNIHFSVEHVLAKSNGGKNTQGNYATMHKKCNEIIGSLPYSEVQKINPQFMDNYRNSLLIMKIKNHKKEITLPDNYFSLIKKEIEKQGIETTFLADI